MNTALVNNSSKPQPSTTPATVRVCWLGIQVVVWVDRGSDLVLGLKNQNAPQKQKTPFK